MRVLTAEQSRLFLDAAMKTPYGPVFAVALTTAARPSEYLALKWHDINWESGTVSIARTLEKVRGGWRFAETKRARSRRVIKLQEWVLELLKRLLAKTKPKPVWSSWPAAAELIFTTPSGRPIHVNKLAKKFKLILDDAGLTTIRLYDLRHTGATLALAAGVPPKVVSEQLGHASSAFTLDVYSHVLPHMQEEAAAKVEAVLTGRSLTPRICQSVIQMC
jgi:integrase